MHVEHCSKLRSEQLLLLTTLVTSSLRDTFIVTLYFYFFTVQEGTWFTSRNLTVLSVLQCINLKGKLTTCGLNVPGTAKRENLSMICEWKKTGRAFKGSYASKHGADSLRAL